MFCKNCGGHLNDNQAVCLRCGLQVGVGNNYCINCGHPVAPNAAVCLHCGVATNGRASGYNNLGGKDKATMAIVCFFLGGLGIHNFMMNENRKGIIKIVFSMCLGVGGILALIDFVKILTDSYEVNPESYF